MDLKVVSIRGIVPNLDQISPYSVLKFSWNPIFLLLSLTLHSWITVCLELADIDAYSYSYSVETYTSEREGTNKG